MKSLVIVLAIVFSSAALYAQDAVQITCVSVEDDDVRVTWSPVQDVSGTFEDFEIYRFNPLTGISTLWATYTDINTTEHLELGTLAASEAILLYVVSTYGGLELNSDTLSTIDLGLTAIVDFSVARLSWKEYILNEDLESYLYYVVQINQDGTWQDLDTLDLDNLDLQLNSSGVPIAVYSHVIQACHLPAVSIPISFRLQLVHESGCISQSSAQEEQFQDATGPTAPEIETVSVDTSNNQAIVFWYPSPEGDIGAYRVLDEFDVQLTEIPDPSVLQYQYPLSNAGSYSEGFYVVPLDTCGNRGPVDQQTPHFTMLPELEFITCSRAIRITWDDYEEWPDGVMNYVILGGLAGSPLEVLDTLSGNADSYLHTGVEVLSQYEYVVKALPFDSRRASLSAKKEIFTDYPDLPDFSYLANVSVIGRNEIELKVLVDPAATRTRYQFQRLDRFGEDFDELLTIGQGAADADGFIRHVDVNREPADVSYIYRMAIVDSCGFEGDYSNESSNIRLTVSADSEERVNKLTWTPYMTWSGEVQSYRIFRSKNETFGSTPYAVVTGNRTYFTDLVDTDQDYLQESQYCYKVQAVETGNLFGQDQKSTSNLACVVQEHLMFIPNAIVVGGANGVFKPIGGYFERERYLMRVFDRWGRILFESSDIDMGWDGMVNGAPVPEGVYAYHMVFFKGDGKEVTRNGIVTVLYASE